MTQTANNAARKVALVTGAAGGIGIRIVNRLIGDGHHVVLVDVHPELGTRVEKLGHPVTAYTLRPCDITNEQDVKSLFRSVDEDGLGVDILVNNAGISPKQDGRSLKAEDTPLAEWAAVINVNLTAPFLLSKAALPHMKAAGWGRIINMASLAGRTRSIVSGAHYSASKAGLIGFSRMFAGEVAPYGITVNCIAPGAIDAGLGAQLNTALTENYSARIPVGRIGKPDEVAAVVAFLASSDTGFITGATFDINGGFYMS